MSLGRNVKDQRTLKMMTQKELSNATGIKVAHLSRIENDEGDLKLSTIYKLLEALNCTPNDLLLDENSSLDAQLSDGIEKVLQMPKELKEEVNSIIGKYLYFSQMAEIIKTGDGLMGAGIDSFENHLENVGEDLLNIFKEKLND